MTKLDKERWEQIRAKGYERFLLRTVIRAGLPFAILMTLSRALWPVVRHRPVEPVWQLAVEFEFYGLFFGVWMGTFTWRCRQRDYNRPTEDDDAP